MFLNIRLEVHLVKKKSIFVLVMTLMFILGSNVFASNGGIEDILKGSFNPSAPSGMDTTVAGILGTLQYIGYAIAIGMLIYIGIKYTMAAADAKADMKSAVIRYVIGAILIAGADAFFGWIIAVGQGV